MYVILNHFIYLFMAVLGLRCCVGARFFGGFFPSFEVQGLLSSVRASHCGGFSYWGAGLWGATASVVVARGLQSAGSIVVAYGLSCSAACGNFPDQGLNPCLLHWQVGSLPPGKPILHGSSGKLI